MWPALRRLLFRSGNDRRSERQVAQDSNGSTTRHGSPRFVPAFGRTVVTVTRSVKAPARLAHGRDAGVKPSFIQKGGGDVSRGGARRLPEGRARDGGLEKPRARGRGAGLRGQSGRRAAPRRAAAHLRCRG